MGENEGGTIQNSYATGNADGGDGNVDYVGGLVGANDGRIRNSYASGNADGGDGNNDYVGGLAGWNYSRIRNSYAAGNADGGAGLNDWVGGLVAQNEGGTIQSSYYNSDASITGELSPITDGTGKTLAQLRSLDVDQTETDFGTGNGWSEDDWDFGSSGTHYPSVLSTSGTLLCAQPGQGTTRVGQPGTCP